MSFHTGLLPREGFHADVVGQLLRRTLLNPFLTVPALLFAKYHDKGQELVARHASERGLSIATVLAILGTLRAVNGFLDRRALNNGVSDNTYDWNREVVLITGGADGIGKAIALMLAHRNVKVAVLDVQALTYDAPPTLMYVKTDITSEEALADAHQQIQARFKASPSVLVLNAGVCRGKTILDSTLKDNQLTFNVNTLAHYSIAREFLPALVQANHGMVVTVASSAAWVTAPAMTDYAGSKAAALAFHEGLSAELVSHYKAPRVRTVVVNQGYTKTKLFAGFGVKKGFVAPPLEVDTVAEEIVRQILSGRSAQLIVPGAYKLMAAHWRSLPNWMQHGARVGLDKLMAGWNGRQVDQAAGK